MTNHDAQEELKLLAQNINLNPDTKAGQAIRQAIYALDFVDNIGDLFDMYQATVSRNAMWRCESCKYIEKPEDSFPCSRCHNGSHFEKGLEKTCSNCKYDGNLINTEPCFSCLGSIVTHKSWEPKED